MMPEKTFIYTVTYQDSLTMSLPPNFKAKTIAHPDKLYSHQIPNLVSVLGIAKPPYLAEKTGKEGDS